eukprot:evm.model.scf_1577.4 EVM.evm.TU.scf_1577.4   scf_1577:20380-24830(-)
MPPIARCRYVGIRAQNETREERLERAKGYPYERPQSSFLYVNGSVFTFENTMWQGIDGLSDLEVTSKRGEKMSTADALASAEAQHGLPENGHWTAVLAVGSNAAPAQLARKFPNDDFPEGIVIPVVQAVLQDFDVVYAPLVSSYGSCTATLEHSPGTAVCLFVTFLTDQLLRRMHETEGAYDVCQLRNVHLHLGASPESWSAGDQGSQELDTVLQYNHQQGTAHLPVEGSESSPVALKAIQAFSRKFPSLSQVDMLRSVRAIFAEPTGNGNQAPALPTNGTRPCWLAEDDDLDSWILSNLDDPNLRGELVYNMSQAARPFQYTHSERMLTIGNMYSANVK